MRVVGHPARVRRLFRDRSLAVEPLVVKWYDELLQQQRICSLFIKARSCIVEKTIERSGWTSFGDYRHVLSHRISATIVAKGFPFLPVDFEHVAGLMSRNRSVLHVEPGLLCSQAGRENITPTRTEKGESRTTGYNQQLARSKKSPWKVKMKTEISKMRQCLRWVANSSRTSDVGVVVGCNLTHERQATCGCRFLICERVLLMFLMCSISLKAVKRLTEAPLTPPVLQPPQTTRQPPNDAFPLLDRDWSAQFDMIFLLAPRSTLYTGSHDNGFTALIH